MSSYRLICKTWWMASIKVTGREIPKGYVRTERRYYLKLRQGWNTVTNATLVPGMHKSGQSSFISVHYTRLKEELQTSFLRTLQQQQEIKWSEGLQESIPNEIRNNAHERLQFGHKNQTHRDGRKKRNSNEIAYKMWAKEHSGWFTNRGQGGENWMSAQKNVRTRKETRCKNLRFFERQLQRRIQNVGWQESEVQ